MTMNISISSFSRLKSVKSFLRSVTEFGAEDADKCSILAPKNVKKIYRDQAKNIAKLVTDDVKKVFGNVESVEELIMSSYASFGIEDDHNHLAGVFIFHDCPNIPALPKIDWEYWLHAMYGIKDADIRNTLWIHYFAYDVRYEMVFVYHIIHHIFKFFKSIEFLYLVLPPGVTRIDCLEEFAVRLLPKGCKNPRKTQSLYRICNKVVTLKYKIRRAVEEDNDDLVALIDLHSKRLKELYGEFYIAEILTTHKDSGRHIIVAEHNGCAVAVIILNETVLYDLLNQEFELTPFNGLRKRSEEDDVELQTSQPDLIQSTTDIGDINLGDKSNKFFAASFEDEDEYFVDITGSESDYSIVLTTSDLFVFDEEEEEPIKEPEELSLTEEEEMAASSTSYEILKEMEKVKSHDVDPRLAYAELMEKLSRSIVSTRSRTLKLPTYAGKGNAFAIEVAASHPDHTTSINYVLESVFECFPDREYCCLSTPTESPMEYWINSSFCRAAPRVDSRFPNSLYICHKSSLLGSLECRVATKDHLTEVYYLLSTIPTRAIVLSHFEISMEFEHSPYQCFVFLCEGQIIGTAVVSEESNIDYIDAQYDISTWVPLHCYKSGSFGVIESLIISPIYHAHGRFFKKELHRLSDYQVLFYKYRSTDRGTYKERPVSSLLHWLQPVLPRKMPEYDFKMLSSEGYETTDALIRKDYYALYLSTVCTSSNEKIVINSRIVVVGGSNTAYAFMESLLLKHINPNYKINFNNVVFVSPDGINKKIPKKVKELFVLQKNFMSEKYMESINLRTYVNVVIGNMTTIDRRQKYIIVNDHKMLRYDLLFLMTGEKFQKPLQSYRLPFSENPMNMFLVNCAMDAYKAIKTLKELQRDPDVSDDNIIVYGHFLQAYSCLAGLLEYGIPGTKIVLVEPFPYSMNIDKKKRHNISVFNDPDIYHSTMEYIKLQGIQMYSSYYFINWDYWEEENRILSVKFESKHKMLEMSCQAIFFFYDKTISPKIYQVVSQCGLVFDGRLVIDTNCKTNDDRIYAAGTLTKYSRRYYAQNLVHKFFNRVEIGTKLGERIRNMLVPGFVKRSDPKTHDYNFHLDISDRFVAKYEKPIMRYCRLPGGLYYLSIVKPGRRIPLETASSMENYGQVFITGSCRNLDHQGFFKIHFNEFNKVETLTCLTKFNIDIKSIHCLWGKHEKLLNNLQLRFEMMLITDFFEYFKQPWAYAIYHDRFENLLDDLNNIMTSSMGPDEECLIATIIDMYKQRKWQQLTTDQKEDIGSRFPDSIYSKIIEQKVLDYIQENLNYLSMYAHPTVVRNLLEGFDKSPLFTK